MGRKTKVIDPSQLVLDFDAIVEDLFIEGDLQNIRNMLPQLYEHQQEDVLRAEQRFLEGKGYLFTNGTGTGKTFVGLGVAKRFFENNKKDILIVVPTEQKSIDWIHEGKLIGLSIYKLEDTNDKGIEISVTTYANFYQNEAINRRGFDLIIYDESHYLNQNAKGQQTTYLEQHKEVAKLPSRVRVKAWDVVGPMPEGREAIESWKKRFEEYVEKEVKRTKVLFLSATPFAYHKSIKYADGCLFDIEESLEVKDNEYTGYNEASGFEKFLCEHFGYSMRYNKVTRPDVGVNTDLMEREFFEKHVEQGIMSTRILELENDYSRQFITVDSDIGNFINSGLELFYDRDFTEKYKYLSRYSSKKFNYNYMNKLLECIKAREIHKRIEAHLKLGRQVVIFHGYNNSLMSHPFHFDPYKMITLEDEQYLIDDLKREIEMFEEEYPEYVNLDLTDLVNARTTICGHIPSTKQFNGTIPKKKRFKSIEDFNDDNSNVNVIVVQEKAGREGISLHDRTGVKQRVLMNLGLPTAPTSAIQIEGRIYRSGLKSNAVYEYITLQTNFERIAFANKIAERSKTAENLAMGNLARDLENAFKEGYINSSYVEPSLEQGTGGKEFDRRVEVMTEFDRAITYYYARAKRNAKTKAREGVDYFATPEPLGYMMVKWLDPVANESGLEPSAGHGAIGRWFPGNTDNDFVEPSLNLSSELAINTKGSVKRVRFEDFYIGNKYHFIAMNPPFGTGGKTAMIHLRKAVKQMYWNGARLIAILPDGPSMNKRLDAFFAEPEFYEKHEVTGIMRLPSATFKRAGTGVRCKIIKIERVNYYNGEKKGLLYDYDLSHIEDVNEFFDTIKDLEF